MTEITFPILSNENESADGVLSSWFVRDGETVTTDQVIAEVQVDKVSAEVPSPVTGVVHLLVPEESVVKQGDSIAEVR